jgi:hypothetical protein
MTLKAGLLNGTSLVARPFASRVPARTIALVSRPGGAHGRDADLMAAFITQHAAPKQKPGLPSLRRRLPAKGSAGL